MFPYGAWIVYRLTPWIWVFAAVVTSGDQPISSDVIHTALGVTVLHMAEPHFFNGFVSHI